MRSSLRKTRMLRKQKTSVQLRSHKTGVESKGAKEVQASNPFGVP